MGRARFGTIAVAVCLVLTIGQPGILDQVRYPLALVLSWPARSLAEWAGGLPRSTEQLDLETLQFRKTWEAAAAKQTNAFGFRVFSFNAEKQSFCIDGGWDRDLRRGAIVHDGIQLLGFVDLVTESASRVRLISHPSSHVAGRIEVDEKDVLPRASSLDLLLTGRGESGLVARQGCRIHLEFAQHLVRYLDEKGLWDLTIGVIERDESMDQLVVKANVDMSTINRVLIGDTVETPEPTGRPGDLTAKILAIGRTSVAGATWLLSRGSQDGVKIGAWVSCGGALIGRVDRAGAFSSYMRPLESDIDSIDCQVVNEAGDLVGLAHWQELGAVSLSPGHYFSRGRAPKNGLPAGLWLGLINHQGLAELPPLPTCGEPVTIHATMPSRTSLRLGLGR
ncbi:MAG: hypothetical protein ACI97A_000600 [Planctomycetota bacterium]|jgi:hypothetical protein